MASLLPFTLALVGDDLGVSVFAAGLEVLLGADRAGFLLPKNAEAVVASPSGDGSRLL